MKRFTLIKVILGSIFYIALMAVAGIIVYRLGWSSGLVASSAGNPGPAMFASGGILAWSIGILVVIILASIPLRIMAWRTFGMAFMHERRGHHSHRMHGFGSGFGPGWGMRHACSHHGPPSSAEMEKWFNKWEERDWEIPERWRKVAQAAVEARKADEDQPASPSENG